jgi:hypothetical protein
MVMLIAQQEVQAARRLFVIGDIGGCDFCRQGYPNRVSRHTNLTSSTGLGCQSKYSDLHSRTGSTTNLHGLIYFQDSTDFPVNKWKLL